MQVYDRKGLLSVISFGLFLCIAMSALMCIHAVAEEDKTSDKCNEFTFDASGSYDIDNQKLSFLWDFGDGTTSTEPVIVHTYEKGGEYTVSLTVSDGSGLPCGSAAITEKILVNTPPDAMFTSPNKVCVKDKVLFDASATKDDTLDRVTYSWDFGDGEKGKGVTVTHVYEKGGDYTVTLMVNDNSGTSCNLDTLMRKIKVNTPPVAEAGDNIVKCLQSLKEEYTVTLDASNSLDVDGDTLEYTWDLGDGSSKKGEHIEHTYLQGGQYKVTLTVDDKSGLSCGTDTDTLNVTLNKSPVSVAGADVKACTGETISFDGSASVTESGENLSYEWSFGGDARANGKKASHTYTEGGRYTVMLTVDDGRETACSQAMDILHVDIDAAPVVLLEGQKMACLGEEVFFDASASSDPDEDVLSYTWNFGDGTKVAGDPQITHVFKKGGTYNVQVSVDDGRGFSCSVASESLKVKVNTPPQANIVMENACCVGMEQKFDASGSFDSDGDKLTYIWDFGDGTTAQGVKATHVYTEPGRYRILLTVDDNSLTECSSDVDSAEIYVNAKPVPVISIR